MKPYIAAAFALLLLCHPAQAQTSYPEGYLGYRDGYNLHTPLSGPPDRVTEYGQGWYHGRDSRDYDDEVFDRLMAHKPPFSIEPE